MTASIFVIVSSSPVLRSSRRRRVGIFLILPASLHADCQSYSSSRRGKRLSRYFSCRQPATNTIHEHNPGPPHCNVQGSFAEIETIYRAYQVLLLKRLRT